MNRVFPEKIVMKGDFLEKMVDSLPGSIHIKEAKTQQYLHSNSKNLVIYDLKKPEDLIGKTVNDLNGFMAACWGRYFSPLVKGLDEKVIKNKTIMVDNNREFLTKSGFVHVQNMTKIPIVSARDNKVIAIFTSSEAITDRLDLLDLYNLYKKLYRSKNEAIRGFLTYTKILEHFYEIPTDAEMKVLLSMRYTGSQKILARLLGVAETTMESHLWKLRKKLKNVEFHFLMQLLLKPKPNDF